MAGLAAGLLAAALAACGGGGGGGDDTPAPAVPTAPATAPVALAPTTEAARAASARIGPDGGSLTATSSQGVPYTLVVPLGALTDTVEIRLTPIADLRVASLARGLLGAVQMEPTGLVFQRAATLRIGAVPSLKPGELLVGLDGANDGSGLGFKPAEVVNGATEIAVFHFSTGGAAAATPAEVAAVPLAPEGTGPTAREVRAVFLDKILRLPWTPQTVASVSQQAALLFDNWFQLDIRPRLDDIARAPPTEAFSGRFIRAIGAYEDWIKTRAWVESIGGEVERRALLATVDAENRPLVARLLVAEIDRALAACANPTGTTLAALRQLQFAAAAQLQAKALGLATPAFALDQATLLSRINGCLRPVLDPIVLPTPLRLGQATSLDARAQLVFNGRPNPESAPFIFTVQPVGATLAQPSGRSDAAGRYTTVFTPTADPVDFTVRACLVFDLFSVDVGSDVCISQRVSASLAPLTLQGNLSRTLAVDDAFDPRAQFRLTLTGFLRIGVDPTGAVTVLNVSGTEERRSILSPDSNSCFDPALGRQVPIALRSSSTSVISSARYTKPVLGTGIGSGFVFHGETTFRGERLLNRNVDCSLTTDVFTEPQPNGLFALDVVQVERDSAGAPVAVVLSGGRPVNGQVTESLRLTVGP